MQTALIAGTVPIGSQSSSQATYVEGSTTIPQGSTPKQAEMGSTPPDKTEGEDIV